MDEPGLGLRSEPVARRAGTLGLVASSGPASAPRVLGGWAADPTITRIGGPSLRAACAELRTAIEPCSTVTVPDAFLLPLLEHYMPFLAPPS